MNRFIAQKDIDNIRTNKSLSNITINKKSNTLNKDNSKIFVKYKSESDLYKNLKWAIQNI